MSRGSLLFLTLLALGTASTPYLEKPLKLVAKPSGGLLQCACSPSEIGFNLTEVGLLRDGAEFAEKVYAGVQDAGVAPEVAVATRQGAFMQSFYECVRRVGYEICVNSDAAMREGKGRDEEEEEEEEEGKEHDSYCAFDRISGRNVAQHKNTFAVLRKCHESMGNIKPQRTAVPHVADMLQAAARFVTPLEFVPSPTPEPADGEMSEGCVAVEHLEGLVLQHKAHLRRKVLCAGGFCATPNHGIFVDGEYTSMKRMCGTGEWRCTEDVKLVNNLKISANVQAKFGDRIVITPYDYRFPAFLIWAVQIAEDVWAVIKFLVVFIVQFVVALVLFIRVVAWKNGRKAISTGEDQGALSGSFCVRELSFSKGSQIKGGEEIVADVLERYPEAPVLEQMGPKVREVVEKLELKNAGANCGETVLEPVSIEEPNEFAEPIKAKDGAVPKSDAASSLPEVEVDNSCGEPSTLEDVTFGEPNTLEDVTFGEPSIEELQLAIEPVESILWNSEPVSAHMPALALHKPALALPKHVTVEEEKAQYSQVSFAF